MSPARSPRRGVPAPRRSSGRRLVETTLWTVVAGLVVVIALSGIGGTYAYWSDEQSLEGAVLSTGTATLSAAWTAEAPTAQALLPGEAVRRTAELTNAGDVPLEITAAIGEDLRSVAVSTAASSCEKRAETATLSTAPRALTGPGTDGRAVVLQPGDTVPLCVTVQATTNLSPGQTAAFTLTLEGKQVQ